MNNKILTDNIYKDDLEQILSEAADLVAGKYIFNNVWDMEPCDEIVDNKRFNWNISYQGDREWGYMFTRFDYSYKLMIAYELTGDRKYLEFGISWMNHWARHNVPYFYKYPGKIQEKLNHHKGIGHRSLDIAILAANIADFSLYCYDRGMMNGYQFQKMKSIVRVIYGNVLPLNNIFRTLANWGPIENGNLLYAVLRLKVDVPYQILIDRLKKELEAQILSDGSQTESSPMYLVQILLTVFKNIYLFREVLPNEIIELTRKGCNYIFRIADPDNCIPVIGDSDKMNISDLMAVAAKLFDDKTYLLRVNRKVDPEYVFRYRNLFDDMIHPNFTYWDTGVSIQHFNFQHLIKDGNRKLYLLLNNIPNGPSGHKHYDYLSFILFLDGKEFLIDSGRETYKWGKIREHSKDSCAHNTYEIDKGSYWKQFNEWDTIQFISVLPNQIVNNGRSVIMGIHLWKDNVKAYRILTYNQDAGILITDYVDGDIFEKYEGWFNFAEGASVIQVENGMEIKINNTGLFYSNDGVNEINVIESRASKRYNQGFEHQAIHCSGNSKFVSHFLLFKEMDIDVTFKNHLLRYSDVRNGKVIEEIKLTGTL